MVKLVFNQLTVLKLESLVSFIPLLSLIYLGLLKVDLRKASAVISKFIHSGLRIARVI